LPRRRRSRSIDRPPGAAEKMATNDGRRTGQRRPLNRGVSPRRWTPFFFGQSGAQVTMGNREKDKAHGLTRRDFLKVAVAGASAAGMAGLPPGMRSTVGAAGSDAPENPAVMIGFTPLTDCASVVIAAELGFDKKFGLKITPSKEASWASVRDKLVNGELDAAHVLYGLIYGVQMGIGGPKKDMAVLMNLNNNGQAITLSKKLYEKGVKDGASLKVLMDKEKREYTFAQTFPTGTHAMWLYYWLAANGINPFSDA